MWKSLINIGHDTFGLKTVVHCVICDTQREYMDNRRYVWNRKRITCSYWIFSCHVIGYMVMPSPTDMKIVMMQSKSKTSNHPAVSSSYSNSAILLSVNRNDEDNQRRGRAKAEDSVNELYKTATHEMVHFYYQKDVQTSAASR